MRKVWSNLLNLNHRITNFIIKFKQTEISVVFEGKNMRCKCEKTI